MSQYIQLNIHKTKENRETLFYFFSEEVINLSAEIMRLFKTYLKAQLTGNIIRTWLTFSRGSLKVINKHSSSNVNIFVQSY